MLGGVPLQEICEIVSSFWAKGYGNLTLAKASLECGTHSRNSKPKRRMRFHPSRNRQSKGFREGPLGICRMLAHPPPCTHQPTNPPTLAPSHPPPPAHPPSGVHQKPSRPSIPPQPYKGPGKTTKNTYLKKHIMFSQRTTAPLAWEPHSLDHKHRCMLEMLAKMRGMVGWWGCRQLPEAILTVFTVSLKVGCKMA